MALALPFQPGSAVLAPLAGMGDVAFRAVCLEQGAAFTYTEMISAKALCYGSEKSLRMLSEACPGERFGVQLFGHEPCVMARAAQLVEGYLGDALALIDVNMGCPVPKVTRKGEGSALMREPTLAAKIAREIVGAVGVPVTAKIRKGYAADDDNAPELAKRLEGAGVSAVCVHGRTAAQMYRGLSDWGVIERVVEAVCIPVIGNGDVERNKKGLRSMGRMLAQTGCYSVMVARGAIGFPWIFSGHEPSPDERIDMALHQAALLHKSDPAHAARRFRKHAAAYVAGMPHAAAARDMLMRTSSLDELTEAFESLRENLHEAA